MENKEALQKLEALSRLKKDFYASLAKLDRNRREELKAVFEHAKEEKIAQIREMIVKSA